MKQFALIIMLFAILSAGCIKDAEIPDPGYPLVMTFVSSDSESIKFIGEIMTEGNQEIISYGFVYETQHGQKVDSIHFKGKPENKFSIELQSGFTPDVLYHLRAFVQTTNHYVFGNSLDFKFNYSKPVELYNYTPFRGTTGDTIVIEGKYFSPSINGNIVIFGSDTGKVVIAEVGKIYVKVPEVPVDQICHISVKTPSSFSSFEGDFERWYNWERIWDSIPGYYQNGTKAGNYMVMYDYWEKTLMTCNLLTGMSNPATQFPGTDNSKNDPVFTCMEMAYIMCNYSKQLWQYDPVTGDWKRKQDIPEELVTYQKPMVIGSIAYFLVDNNVTVQLWAYDALTNVWTLKTNLPEAPSHSVLSFATENKGYFCSDRNGKIEVYEFDPDSCTIKFLSTYPGKGVKNLAGFFINGKIYIGLGHYDYFEYQAEDLWEFNNHTLEWKKSFSFPNHEGYIGYSSKIFSKDGYLTRNYFSSKKTEVYYFDPAKQ